MYRHALVPIDCSPEARRAALDIIPYVSGMPNCKVMLVATHSPAADENARAAKVRHAREALRGIQNLLLNYGVYSRTRVLEDEDAANALAAESTDDRAQYDVILASAYQTRPLDEDEPCRGSLIDRLSTRVKLPIVLLPPAAGYRKAG